ncbi:hypothetical protein PanWU01x14_259900 [Parasponia andersonii]|uniref:RNase H type-1 domain-containing protein n=1 Tax=Parasponia andersonii TaxID=3476 RepID=A0A2P5B920_PARAD|nr:hypothetical protein PanWU01x14_259900 [Parasponia andersonii]
MRELMPFFTQVVVTFVSRECNYYAHNLASWAYVCNFFDTLNPSEVPAASLSVELALSLFWWPSGPCFGSNEFIFYQKKKKKKKGIRGIFHIIDVLILLTLSMPR